MEPPKQVVPIHRNVLFLCGTTTQAIWTLNDAPLPKNAFIVDQKLTIEKIDRKNGGIYECKGTTERGETFYAEGKLKIKGVTIITRYI